MFIAASCIVLGFAVLTAVIYLFEEAVKDRSVAASAAATVLALAWVAALVFLVVQVSA